VTPPTSTGAKSEDHDRYHKGETHRMKPDDFIRKFHLLFPDCKPDAAQNWQTFAVECVDQHQYVHFKAAKSRDACIEDWLGVLYEGLRQTKDRFGTAVSTQVADLSCEPCCLYPGEMPQAAECQRR